MSKIQATEDQIEANARIIIAAERWSKEYKKDLTTHSKIIRIEARMERTLRKFFREMADRAPGYVNWYAYETKLRQLQAAEDFSVEVIVDDKAFSGENDAFVGVFFKEVEDSVSTGAAAGQNIYARNIGISSVDEMVQMVSKERIAYLVGKRLDRDGIIVDNPNAKYRVTDKTRNSVRQSISTSLSLGEDQKAAVERLRKTVADPARAELIAQTEAVNGYQGGMYGYAKAAGAVAKEWQNLGATDFCKTNTDAGIIPIDDKFPSGHQQPSAHPRCRCGVRYVWPEELEDRSTLTKVFQDEVGAVDLASIAQEAGTRPNADINTKIELLLGSNKPEAIVESIRLAQTLPPEDAVAMLRSISYNSQPVVNQYYTVRLNPVTKRIETILKDPKVDPLKISPADLAKAAGVPLPKE